LPSPPSLSLHAAMIQVRLALAVAAPVVLVKVAQ
jgi:hypothetical protein